MSIRSFKDKIAQEFFITGKLKKGIGWAPVRSIVRRKLDMLHYAQRLQDLRMPPNNRLEALKGKLKGYFSIRVNDQWRIVFEWTEAGPVSLSVTDYH